MMGFFDIFRKKTKLTEQEHQWNMMWELWVDGMAESPYAQLMTYESEVNNGGHSQYFLNVSNCGDLQKDIDVLLDILPSPLRGNLKAGYEAFMAQADDCDDANEELFEEYDDVFYENEELITSILRVYADGLTF